MTAEQIVEKRTGMSQEDAGAYVDIAEAKVRTYLGLDDEADLTPYTFQIAEIAVLYWQWDSSVQNSAHLLGMKSQSFSEGGVSESKSGMTGAEIQTQYEDAIRGVLEGLDGNVGKVVFL